jgi:hypothetical protein
MWEVWKMQGAIFNHGHMRCFNTTTMDGGSADIAGAIICPYI